MKRIKSFFHRLFGIIQPGDLVLCERSWFEQMEKYYISWISDDDSRRSPFYIGLAIEKYKTYEIDKGIGMSGYYRKGWKVLVNGEIREVPKYNCWKFDSFKLKMSSAWITIMMEIVGGKK